MRPGGPTDETTGVSGVQSILRTLLGLQSKFTIVIIGMTLAVGGLVATVSVGYATEIIKQLYQDQCRQLASALAEQAADDCPDGPAALHRLAEDATRTGTVLFVAFTDPDGLPLASATASQAGLHFTRTAGLTRGSPVGLPLFVPRDGDRPAYLDVTYPVRTHAEGNNDGAGGSALVGYVRVAFSVQRALADVTVGTNLLSGFTVIMLGLAIPLGFYVVRRLVAPINLLARTMCRFADGDMNARCHIRRTDEIGQLADAYNLMADRLTQEHDEIVRLNSELEERVQQRTRQLRELAARDPLTGLYNRRHFNEVLARRFAEAKRYGHDLACMMIDLDDFKSVNDRFGHQSGDELLILATITITTELRGADVAARFGGDEFIVLLPQTDTNQARILGGRIMRKFQQSAADHFPHCPISLSVGIGSLVEVTTEDPDDLIRAADKALYDAKTSGKNTIATRQVSA